MKRIPAALIIGGVATVSLIAGCLPGSFVVTPVTTNRALEERSLYRESLFPAGKVAVIDVEGVLLNTETPGLLAKGEHPVSRLLEQLDKADQDPAVKAVVLRINSPGGTVTASELMHAEILRFRSHGKPVVAMMMDVAASGGYYIACATDEIVACRSTVTGSIGVLMLTFDVTGTMGKLGVSADTIKSGEQKGAGSPFQKMTPEQRQVFQTMIDQLYAQFVDVVAAGRPKMPRERILQLADGRIYTAEQAVENGLIDRLGTMRDAIDAAKARAGIRTARIVSYTRPWGYAGNYYAAAPNTAPQSTVNLLNVDLSSWPNHHWPPFMYLWTAP